MKIIIVTGREEGDLTIDDFEGDSVLDLVEAMESPVWHFSLDDGQVDTYIFRDQVVRVDIEHEDPTSTTP